VICKNESVEIYKHQKCIDEWGSNVDDKTTGFIPGDYGILLCEKRTGED